jgi:hypothetical protein
MNQNREPITIDTESHINPPPELGQMIRHRLSDPGPILYWLVLCQLRIAQTLCLHVVNLPVRIVQLFHAHMSAGRRRVHELAMTEI